MGGENIYLGLLNELRAQRGTLDEANTSMHILEMLKKCLRWKRQLIEAQKSTRGFIDYELTFPNSNVRAYVEVKALGKRLKDEQITKYLEHAEDLRIGALTNFEEWWIYIAGRKIKELTGNNVIRIRRISIERREDITRVSRYLTYSRTGTEKRLLATLGEVPSIVKKFLCEDDEVLKAIRTNLKGIQENAQIAVCVPQFSRLRPHVQRLLSGETLDGCPFSPAKLRKAMGHRSVSTTISLRLQEALSARRDIGSIQSTIRQMLRNAKKPEIAIALALE